MDLRDLPDSHPVYIPGVGEVTVGAIRATAGEPEPVDEWEGTLRMWAYIALNPDARPWEENRRP